MGARGFAASRVIWGGSPSRTQRSVMQTDWMVGSDGISYMIFVMISSMIARRPRAPIWRSMAFSAMASSAPFSKLSST